MDFLQSLRIVSTPRWVKIIIALLIIAALCVSVVVGYVGLKRGAVSSVEASAYLLGIVFPILLISIVILGSKGGESALRKKTRDVLLKDIPRGLAQIPDVPSRMVLWRRFASMAPAECKAYKDNSRAKVYVAYREGNFYSDYKVLVPLVERGVVKGRGRLVHMRVEVNVKRVNFNLLLCDRLVLQEIARAQDVMTAFYMCLNDEAEREECLYNLGLIRERFDAREEVGPLSLESICSGTACAARPADRDVLTRIANDFIMTRFGHTFFGAGAGAVAGGDSGRPARAYYEYRFNNKIGVRWVMDDCCAQDECAASDARPGGEYFYIVAPAAVPDDFLWDSAERLYFCQDLMLMMRAFINECPYLFEEQ